MFLPPTTAGFCTIRSQKINSLHGKTAGLIVVKSKWEGIDYFNLLGRTKRVGTHGSLVFT